MTLFLSFVFPWVAVLLNLDTYYSTISPLFSFLYIASKSSCLSYSVTPYFNSLDSWYNISNVIVLLIYLFISSGDLIKGELDDES